MDVPVGSMQRAGGKKSILAKASGRFELSRSRVGNKSTSTPILKNKLADTRTMMITRAAKASGRFEFAPRLAGAGPCLSPGARRGARRCRAAGARPPPARPPSPLGAPRAPPRWERSTRRGQRWLGFGEGLAESRNESLAVVVVGETSTSFGGDREREREISTRFFPSSNNNCECASCCGRFLSLASFPSRFVWVRLGPGG